MSELRQSPPRGAGKAAAIIAVVVALVIVAIFVGFNMQHAQTQRAQQAGQHVDDPAAQPKSPTDLQAAPSERTPK